MKKTDRLSALIQVYLEGDLDLNTAAAELTHAYLHQGWRFSLVEADCEPQHRERMRVLAERIEAEVIAAHR